MTHLQKQTNATTREGITISRMACVNDPFLRGHIVDLKTFREATENGVTTCKKCQKIANRIK